MSETKEKIQKNIAIYRKKANLTQKDLAARLGIAVTNVASWEQGKSAPDIDTLFSVCSILNVSILDISGFESTVNHQIEDGLQNSVNDFTHASTTKDGNLARLSENKVLFAKKLKEARKNAGYTQSAVADLISRPQPTIGAWEVGRSQPDMSTLATLLRIYNMSANDFFDYQSDTINFTYEEIEHIKKYRTLDEYGKKLIITIMDFEFNRVQQQSQVVAFEPASKDGHGAVIETTKDQIEKGEAIAARLISQGKDESDL